MFKCGGGEQEEVLKLERVRVRRKRRGMECLFPMFCLLCFFETHSQNLFAFFFSFFCLNKK